MIMQLKLKNQDVLWWKHFSSFLYWHDIIGYSYFGRLKNSIWNTFLKITQVYFSILQNFSLQNFSLNCNAVKSVLNMKALHFWSPLGSTFKTRVHHNTQNFGISWFPSSKMMRYLVTTKLSRWLSNITGMFNLQSLYTFSSILHVI